MALRLLSGTLAPLWSSIGRYLPWLAGGGAVLLAGFVLFQGIRSFVEDAIDRRAETDLAQAAEPQLKLLRQDPALLPDLPDDSIQTASIRGVFDGRGFSFGADFLAGPGRSLRFDRARTSRLTTPPNHWVFVFDAEGDVTYWVPLYDPGRIRMEPAGIVRRRPASFRLDLPFEPEGTVAVFANDLAVAPPVRATAKYPASLTPATGTTP